MSNELISVIMSAYNEPEEWIRKSIESITNQTYHNIELIIVCDNPENKKLLSILNEYKDKDDRINIIINEVNLGLTNSLNKALKYVNGTYIARMDTDDISINNRLEKQLEYLKRNNLDLVGAGVLCIDENEKEITTLNNFPKDTITFKKKIINNNCMPHPTWLGKKEVFIKNNGYRNIPYAEDYDFLLRAVNLGFNLGNINEVLLKYRIRSTSISNKNGLRQFRVSQELVKKFKNDTINNSFEEVLEDINLVFNNINEIEEDKYYKASTEFTNAAMKLKKLNPVGIISIIKALIISKYYRKKIICYVKGLL